MEESIKINIVPGDGGCDNINTYSPLTLAYVGDSVLDLYIKTHYVLKSNKQTYKYHKEVTDIVRAVNQADFVDFIFDELSSEEQDVYKRGRNANTHSKAKHATMSEYRKATGLEALFGYLYLTNNTSRLEYMAGKMLERYEISKGNAN